MLLREGFGGPPLHIPRVGAGDVSESPTGHETGRGQAGAEGAGRRLEVPRTFRANPAVVYRRRGRPRLDSLPVGVVMRTAGQHEDRLPAAGGPPRAPAQDVAAVRAAAVAAGAGGPLHTLIALAADRRIVDAGTSLPPARLVANALHLHPAPSPRPPAQGLWHRTGLRPADHRPHHPAVTLQRDRQPLRHQAEIAG